MHDLYYYEKAFGYDAFACFIFICELSYESIRLRWHPDVNDCVERLVFEAHLSTSVVLDWRACKPKQDRYALGV